MVEYLHAAYRNIVSIDITLSPEFNYVNTIKFKMASSITECKTEDLHVCSIFSFGLIQWEMKPSGIWYLPIIATSKVSAKLPQWRKFAYQKFKL